MATIVAISDRATTRTGTLEDMKIDVTEDDLRRLIESVDHYDAYLHSQKRDDEKYRDLLRRLRGLLGKRG
jgi:hypothetical protein